MITEADIKRILEAITEAYEKAGKKIKLATCHKGDKYEVLVDNRDEDELQ